MKKFYQKIEYLRSNNNIVVCNILFLVCLREECDVLSISKLNKIWNRK